MNKYIKQYIKEEMEYFNQTKREATKKFVYIDSEVAEKVVKMIILEQGETMESIAKSMGTAERSLYGFLSKKKWSKDFCGRFEKAIEEKIK